MAVRPARTLRCAIYTRKSSEEGLEQSFNSLDAQREACAAYILSQRHEGWTVVAAAYDDGGYSGGTIDRPAVQRLLADVAAGRINVVVVYKVDRLTRSLADFAKIVETFDAQGVSFVSVTQQFNTTSSMGRLTLNVLLSFAQFEREVTGERIRDKIAASRRKGMWMGGVVPLGYDVQDRKLAVNQAEAELVRRIYARYLELGCVRRLKAWLDDQGIVSKLRPRASGKHQGGKPLSRGALYCLLQNRVYIGQAVHKGEAHPGEHDPIVDDALWRQVQQQLADNRQTEKQGRRAKVPSLLAGLLHDDQGRRLTPSHAVKGNRRYRYYVTQGNNRSDEPAAGRKLSLPAHDIEQLVHRAIVDYLQSPERLSELLGARSGTAALRQKPAATARHQLEASAQALAKRLSAAEADQRQTLLRDLIQDVVVAPDEVRVLLRTNALLHEIVGDGADTTSELQSEPGDPICIFVPARAHRCNGESRILLPRARSGDARARPNAALIKALARAHDWKRQLLSGRHTSLLALANAESFSQRYVSQTLRLAYLAPDLVSPILDGRQPMTLNVERLMQQMPACWSEQRRLFGFD